MKREVHAMILNYLASENQRRLTQRVWNYQEERGATDQSWIGLIDLFDRLGHRRLKSLPWWIEFTQADLKILENVSYYMHHLVVLSILVKRFKCLDFLSNFNSSGLSHIGWLFTTEEQKNLGSWRSWVFCHIYRPCFGLYRQTAGHKIAALTTVSSHRQTAGHKIAALTTVSSHRQTAGHKIAALTTCLRLFQPSNFNKQDEKPSWQTTSCTFDLFRFCREDQWCLHIAVSL